METVLVTGGAGFIGSNLTKLLLEYGFNVRVIDNLSTGFEKNLKGLDIELVKADIRDIEALKKCLKTVKTVFHLAAHIGNVKSIQHPFEDLDINARGTLTLLEAIKEMEVEKIIYSSSAAIYGELKSQVVSENHPIEPESLYGVSKLTAEKYILAYGKLYGITSIALRYFNVYGINQRYDHYGNVTPIFMNRITSRKSLTVFGNGLQTRDFINVKDVAYANFLAAKNGIKSDFFNVGCGTSISINSLIDILKDLSEFPFEVEFAPPRKGEVLHCTADISKLQKEFNFIPSIDFKYGIKEYYDWFLNEQQQ